MNPISRLRMRERARRTSRFVHRLAVQGVRAAVGVSSSPMNREQRRLAAARRARHCQRTRLDDGQMNAEAREFQFLRCRKPWSDPRCRSVAAAASVFSPRLSGIYLKIHVESPLIVPTSSRMIGPCCPSATYRKESRCRLHAAPRRIWMELTELCPTFTGTRTASLLSASTLNS